MSYTFAQKLAALERELRFRFRVYPRRVTAGSMTEAAAHHEINILQAIMEDYREQRELGVSAITARKGTREYSRQQMVDLFAEVLIRLDRLETKLNLVEHEHEQKQEHEQ